MCVEYIRGINVSQELLFKNSIEAKVLQEEFKYSRINHYKVGFLTWNIAGKNYDEDMNIEATLLSDKESLNDPVDLYFVSFQETRKLNAMALLKGASKSRISNKL